MCFSREAVPVMMIAISVNHGNSGKPQSMVLGTKTIDENYKLCRVR